jgi:hypothetical protein
MPIIDFINIAILSGIGAIDNLDNIANLKAHSLKNRMEDIMACDLSVFAH